MGLKARKKAGVKNVKKATAQFSASKEETTATDYLVLFLFDSIILIDFAYCFLMRISLITFLGSIWTLQPLESGQARGIPETENRENKTTVLYIGRIPHGF